MHHWETWKKHTAEQAVQAHAIAVPLVAVTTDLKSANGSANISPQLYEYLEKKNRIQETGK